MIKSSGKCLRFGIYIIKTVRCVIVIMIWVRQAKLVVSYRLESDIDKV